MRKKINIIFLALLIGNQAISFDFDGGQLANQASNISGGASNINSTIHNITSGLNFANGIGFDNFNLNGFSTSFGANCDLPRPSANLDICDILQRSTGFDIFGHLSRTINIGKCHATFGAGLGDGLNDMFRNLCGVGRQHAEISWSTHEVNMEKLLEAKALDRTAKPIEVVTNDDKRVKLKTVTYKNGQTTQSLFGKNGILTHKAISAGRVPTNLRTAYARDDVVTYDAYLDTAKTYQPDDPSKQLDVKIGVPETYIEYEAKKQAVILEEETLVPSRKDYESKLRDEIKQLKDEHNFGTLNGSTSTAMLQDYKQKIEAIINDLVSLETEEDANGEDTPKTEYGKYIKGLRQYERGKFIFKQRVYRRTHDTVVQPSNKKVRIQPVQNQMKYASKIMLQQAKEIDDEVRFNEMFEKKKNDILDFTIKIFYETLNYRPEIAQKEIEELLQ